MTKPLSPPFQIEFKSKLLACAQKYQDWNAHHSTKPIICMTANLPFARDHMLSFISGGLDVGEFSR